MKLLYLTEILLVSLLTFSPVRFFAQDRRSLTRAQIDSILHPKLMAGAEKVIRFSRPVVSIGKLTEDHQPVDVVFPFQNIGNKVLSLPRITTDCGCTVAKADKESYAAGEKGKVIVRYTPKNHVGTIDASTWVFSSLSASHPVARLMIRGEVLPGEDYWKGYRYVMGTLRLKQNQLQFSLGASGMQTERILCANAGQTDLKLSVKDLPPFIQFRTEPLVIAPGDEADLVIRVDASKYTGNDEDKTIPLVIDGLSVPLKERTLILVVHFSK